MNTKFFLFLFILLIISSFSSNRKLKEENYNSKEEENHDENESSEEEPEENEISEEKTDFSKISPSNIRKENMPHSQVLLPIRRIGTSNSEISDGPCGGVAKKSSNTLTTKGSTINFIWEIIVPEISGNCTVKISKGLQEEENFELLKPVDGKIYSDGSFICGREKGFEHKDFILPKDYECDGCTLQWKWATSFGNFYSCSDIIINGGNLGKCMGKCLNGGSCFNGECLCVEGFSGDFCENEEGKHSTKWLFYLLGFILLGGALYLIWKYWDKIKNLFKKTQPWTTNQQQNASFAFKEEQSKNNFVDPNQIEENSKYHS